MPGQPAEGPGFARERAREREREREDSPMSDGLQSDAV